MEEAKRQTQAPVSVDAAARDGKVSSLELLGALCWLYSHSPVHRAWPAYALHQWLMPAIETQQMRLYRRGNQPVAFVSWARLSKQVEEAYVRNTSSLRPTDWRSGERLWLIDWVAPFGGTKAIARDLRNNVFPHDVGRGLRLRQGDDTLRIFYLHGAKAVAKARDRSANPTVVLNPRQEYLQ